jgi:hypothetical protein
MIIEPDTCATHPRALGVDAEVIAAQRVAAVAIHFISIADGGAPLTPTAFSGECLASLAGPSPTGADI